MATRQEKIKFTPKTCYVPDFEPETIMKYTAAHGGGAPLFEHICANETCKKPYTVRAGTAVRMIEKYNKFMPPTHCYECFSVARNARTQQMPSNVTLRLDGTSAPAKTTWLDKVKSLLPAFGKEGEAVAHAKADTASTPEAREILADGAGLAENTADPVLKSRILRAFALLAELEGTKAMERRAKEEAAKANRPKMPVDGNALVKRRHRYEGLPVTIFGMEEGTKTTGKCHALCSAGVFLEVEEGKIDLFAFKDIYKLVPEKVASAVKPVEVPQTVGEPFNGIHVPPAAKEIIELTPAKLAELDQMINDEAPSEAPQQPKN